jgi:hypothetical protein
MALLAVVEAKTNQDDVIVKFNWLYRSVDEAGALEQAWKYGTGEPRAHCHIANYLLYHEFGDHRTKSSKNDCGLEIMVFAAQRGIGNHGVQLPSSRSSTSGRPGDKLISSGESL